MTLQSSVASKVTVIAGILVCIMVGGGGGGGFSATKTKVARNCLKRINLRSKNFPSSWTKRQGGGGLFCHKNQSCSKLPETDKSEVKKFSLILGGGGGGFSATKTKVAPNCLKRINLRSKNFPSSWGGGGGFSATKTKVAPNCLKRINLRSKNFPSSWGGGGGFSATKTKVARNCLKRINLRSKNFPSSWGGGGGLFCHKPK